MNILIIENDPIFAKNIIESFQKEKFSNRIDHISNYYEYAHLKNNIWSYDIILLDIDLWGKKEDNWLSILAYIRKHHTQVPIIMITGNNEYSCLQEAFEKWAHDYLIKPFRPRELQIRIERWFRNYIFGEYFAITKSIEYHGLTYNLAWYQFFYNQKEIVLSRGSKYILSLLFIMREKIVTHEYLCEKIWGDIQQESQKNTRIKVMRLKEQLNSIWLDTWIENIHGEGYIFRKNEL